MAGHRCRRASAPTAVLVAAPRHLPASYRATGSSPSCARPVSKGWRSLRGGMVNLLGAAFPKRESRRCNMMAGVMRVQTRDPLFPSCPCSSWAARAICTLPDPRQVGLSRPDPCAAVPAIAAVLALTQRFDPAQTMSVWQIPRKKYRATRAR